VQSRREYNSTIRRIIYIPYGSESMYVNYTSASTGEYLGWFRQPTRSDIDANTAAITELNSSMGQLRVSSGDSFTSEEQGISGNGYSKCLQQLLNSFSAVHKRDIILFASDFNSLLFTGFISMATETVGFFMCTATADATIIKGRVVYGESDCTIWRAIGNTN